VRRRNNSKEQFPANANKVKEPVKSRDVLDLAIFVLSRVKHASSDELREPGLLLLVLNLLKKLLECFCLFLALDISANIDKLERLFAKLGACRSNIGKLKAKALISHINIGSWQNRNYNSLLCFTCFENQSSTY